MDVEHCPMGAHQRSLTSTGLSGGVERVPEPHPSPQTVFGGSNETRQGAPRLLDPVTRQVIVIVHECVQL